MPGPIMGGEWRHTQRILDSVWRYLLPGMQNSPIATGHKHGQIHDELNDKLNRLEISPHAGAGMRLDDHRTCANWKEIA